MYPPFSFHNPWKFEKTFPPNSTTEMIITSSYTDLIAYQTISLRDYDKLTSVSLKFESIRNNYQSYPNLCDFKIINFPPNVKHISLSNCNFRCVDITKLPLSVETLYISDISSCSDNYYTNLPQNLERLTILNDNIILQFALELNNLPSKLKHLILSNVIIRELNNLPTKLETLYISYTSISNLDYLPETLKRLECAHNRITSLDNLPRGLEYLDCGYNEISQLNNLPDGVKQLNCESNKIISIDRLPKSLNIANCANNPLITKPKCPKFTIILNYSLDMKKASIVDKANMMENKMIYGLYIIGKYFARGVSFGISKCTNAILHPFGISRENFS